MAATKNASTATWGVTSVSGEVGSVKGVVTDFTLTRENIETSDVQNEEGMAVLRKIIEEHCTIDATITCKNDVTPPKTGDTITIDNTKYFITSATKTESNQNWTSIRISAEKYTNCDTITQTDSVKG